jgi:hypothetical protein
MLWMPYICTACEPFRPGLVLFQPSLTPLVSLAEQRVALVELQDRVVWFGAGFGLAVRVTVGGQLLPQPPTPPLLDPPLDPPLPDPPPDPPPDDPTWAFTQEITLP